MSSSIKLAEYLFTRLRQLGVDSIHGVPGDYNLTLLDYVQPSGLRWVGNANELNAAYAADGYARIKGLGAVVTTFGVGELSAINAIAGAYAEFAPVVHIVGIPVRDAQQSRKLIHHTFNDGEYRRFAAMHAHVTVYQACLNDPRTSAEQIDEALRQCLLHSRPVYIEVPVDMVAKPLSKERLESPIALPEAQPNKDEDEVLSKIMNRIYSAKQPLIVVDGETRPLRICEDVQALIKNTKWPTWSMPFGKGLTDETLDNFHGVYKGCFDDQPVQDFYQGSDLVLFFGPHFSNTNSSNYTTIPKDDAAILFTINGVQIGTRLFRDVSSKNIVSHLVRDLDPKQVPSYTPYPKLPRDILLPIPEKPTDEILAQDKLWKTLANVIEPGDIILGETGTAGFGVREMAIPQHTRVFTPVTWLSIGYMLPGAQGAALAQKELIEASKYHGLSSAKTILVIGDGSFQMTVQELATMVRHHLNVVVFLINNDGYTIERCIHGRNQEYNDVTPWRYLQAPSFFGAKETTYTGSAKTWRELKEVLEHEGLTKGKELRMVEIFLDRDDCPKGPLLNYMEAQKNGKGVLA